MADPTQFMPGFAEFISASPTSYHAAATMAEGLAQAGFERLDERRRWGNVAGRRFFVRGGALVAWVGPEQPAPDAGVRIVGTHTDSPALKLKPNPSFTRAGWRQANVEIYGGPLINSWLDRELGLAGRLVTLDGTEHLVHTGPVLRISQIAPHFDRSVNERLTIDRQYELMPSYGLGEGPDIAEWVCEQAGLPAGEVAFGDIHAYPTQAPAVFGIDGEFFASSRLDNLSSTYPAYRALLGARPGRDIALFVAFDHEEVGSGTSSGAAGPLLSDALVRIADGYGLHGDAYQALLARSSCVSADASHAVNPNHVGKYDPVVQPAMNQGPALKVNAQQRYASDAVSAAQWERACRAAGVPHQAFVSNNDVACGTTIGPLTAQRLGIATVDVGVPILSMHSTREMCGTSDPGYLCAALAAYWAGA
ncbi:M18 family aminopeptidase [Propionibacterium ruminifibrarum]|nr:M18 family aminopeptidase [Propionibacterium ruminifibrarum]